MARPSHVRTAIAALLAESDRHGWSLDEIAAALQERGTAADFSSVFRGVERLAQEGVVARIELGDGKARFEPAAAHHEHVRCELCGKVEEVPGCVVAAVIPAVAKQTGFAISGHTLVFSGTCSACSPEV